MKKVLFMFVAVLALVSCQKGAEKSSEVSNDSTKTEAVEKKAAEATELVAPEKTGDIAEDLIAQAKFVLAKIKACKTAEEFGAIEEDQCMKDFEALMSKAEKEATPEQKEKLLNSSKIQLTTLKKQCKQNSKKLCKPKCHNGIESIKGYATNRHSFFFCRQDYNGSVENYWG